MHPKYGQGKYLQNRYSKVLFYYLECVWLYLCSDSVNEMRQVIQTKTEGKFCI